MYSTQAHPLGRGHVCLSSNSRYYTLQITLMILGQNRRPRVTIRSSFGHLLFWAKTAGRGPRFGVVSFTYYFGAKTTSRGSRFGVVSVTCDFGPKPPGRGSRFGVVSVTDDFGLKPRASGHGSE